MDTEAGRWIWQQPTICMKHISERMIHKGQEQIDRPDCLLYLIKNING
jgi:hypothetical protein